jgi:phytanoyl-CoA hydroxylase
MSQSLTLDQVAQFEEEGYLIVEDLFEFEEDLAPVIEEYEQVLDNLATELFEQGTISTRYEDLPFSERLTRIYGESGIVHAQYFDFSLPQSDIRGDTPMWIGPSVFDMLTNPKLLDAVESIVGPEIYSNPVQHVRLKPPESLTPVDDNGRVQLGKTPIHQDNGVVLPEADASKILTVWFSFYDTSVENGCLCVWPGSHRRGLVDHCPSPIGARIPAGLVEGKAISAEMKQGSALFLDKLTLHASHSNHSDKIRFSFDLRYNPVGQATGRGAFPGFVARSRSNPSCELRDPHVWANLWYDARSRLATEGTGAFNRWSADSPVCA